MGWQSIRIVGASACVIFIFLQKIKKMMNKDMTFRYHPVGAPTCLRKQEVRKPSWNIAQPCAKVQSCVNDDLRADGLQKGWGFRDSTWNVNSLTGRADEVVEAWHAFKKHDGKVVVGSSMELKAKDISGSGWEGK